MNLKRTTSSSRRLLSKVLVLGTSLSMLSIPLYAEDDFSFEVLDAKVQNKSGHAIDTSIRAMERGDHEAALLGFQRSIRSKKTSRKQKWEAEYQIAKTYYRMGNFHAALHQFGTILDAGKKHSYFEKSQEWLIYLAQKLEDKGAVLSEIAASVEKDGISADGQAELNFLLSKHYFAMALDSGELDTSGYEYAEEQEDRTFEFSDSDLNQAGDENDDEGFEFDDDDLGGGDRILIAKRSSRKKRSGKSSRRRRSTRKSTKSQAEKKSSNISFGDPTESFSGKERNTTRVVRQKFLEAESALKESVKFASKVPKKNRFYTKALYVKGLGQYALGLFEESVETFRRVVRETHPKEGSQKNPELREMAFFSLARVHYQFQQFRYALFYYDRVSRDSRNWLDAIFESAWANFRMGQYEKSLGNLVTLQAPFFENEYYPERDILKAITFYQNCRYPEARTFLKSFKERYTPVLEDIESLQERDPNQLLEHFVKLEQELEGADEYSQDSRLSANARLVRLALSDKRVAQLRSALVEIDNELESLGGLPQNFRKGLGAGALDANEKRRKEVVNRAGNLLESKLKIESDFLRGLASKLVRIEFEIAKGEKSGLEAQLRNEGQAVPLKDYRYSVATDDERVYYPFDGEYWRDELGTYEYTLTRGCREANAS